MQNDAGEFVDLYVPRKCTIGSVNIHHAHQKRKETGNWHQVPAFECWRDQPAPISASNRIIGAKDHASVQINIAEVDKVTGRFNGQFKTYAICGAIRRMGESDDSILRLAKNDSVVAKNI